MKIIKQSRVPVLCGIKIDEEHGNKIEFNWNLDDEDDVLHLATPSSGSYNNDGVRYIYAYQYNPKASYSKIKYLRNALKDSSRQSMRERGQFAKFVESGIDNLDKFVMPSEFSVIVRAKPFKSSSLVDAMTNCIMDWMDAVPFEDIDLIKNTYNHVEFDTNKAFESMHRNTTWADEHIKESIETANNQFEYLKENYSLSEFQMKEFVPIQLRAGFLHFLKFQSEEEENLYRSLQGVDVLLFDDFLTSGATVKEMIRCLRSIHDSNRLTVFVLVKQH